MAIVCAPLQCRVIIGMNIGIGGLRVPDAIDVANDDRFNQRFSFVVMPVMLAATANGVQGTWRSRRDAMGSTAYGAALFSGCGDGA